MTQPDLPEYAIIAEGLEKTYAGSKKREPKQALKGIDLKVRRGSIFGLLGPNGAGKSTFINILAGLTNKTGGSASIWGNDITSAARNARASIGVVPQEINMDVFFTPHETLELMAGFYGVPSSERRSDELLEVMGLSDKRNAYVRQLSGGMTSVLPELHTRRKLASSRLTPSASGSTGLSGNALNISRPISSLRVRPVTARYSSLTAKISKLPARTTANLPEADSSTERKLCASASACSRVAISLA